MPSRTSLAIATLLVLSGPSAAAAAPDVVGVLESAQCATEPMVGIRPLFVKTAASWQALDEAGVHSLAQGVQWTVSLDGKSLGVLQTDGAFDDGRVLKPAKGQTVPPIGNAQQRFAGWCETPGRRPLIASTTHTSTDLDLWKPFKPDRALVESLLPAFRMQVGEAVLTCKGEATSDWRYDAKSLQLSAAYQDRHGRRLVGVALDAATNNCDGPPEPGWQPHWFVLIDNSAPTFVATNLDLVDAVDVDNDGSSELLLWRSDYNQDGYLLLHGKTLQEHVEKQWSYH